MITQEEDPHFHNCFELERALVEYCGLKGSWYGKASAFEDPETVKKALEFAAKKMEEHTNERITFDERLREMLLLSIESLKHDITLIEPGATCQLEIIAHLLHIIAHLLGYDYGRGEINRHIIYYQTREQLERDVDSETAAGWKNRAFEYVKLHEVIRFLLDQGIPRKQIGLILNIPYHKVCSYLRKEDHYLRTKKAMLILEKGIAGS